jgi:hypothetical protein
MVAVTTLLAAAGVVRVEAQKTYGPGFGLSEPIIATGSSIEATYFGWEPSTVYGNEIYALTGADYASDLANGCFAFDAINRTSCGNLAGLLGFELKGGKPYGVTCPATQACDGPQSTTVIPWIPGTEVIFALLVNQDNGQYNWFFSGDPTRNHNVDPASPDGYAHLAFFPSGVPGDGGTVSGTTGLGLFGFEDVTYGYSDWDFNNAIFAVDAGSIGTLTELVPEPGTLSMIGGGLAGLCVLAARRPRRRKAPDP